MSLRIQRLVRLCHMVVIFLVRCHVNNFIGYSRVFRIGLIDLAVRSLHKSVLVDPCVGGQGVDQTDVGTLRGLDGAHSSVMGVVYVADLESCTVSGQTARSQGGQTSLVGQLTQRVVLIHKLGQLGGSEELLHRSGHRLDIDQGLGRDTLQILGGHSLADHSLQSGQTDPVLVLQKLAHSTDTAVAQVVDVVVISKSILQMHIIVNGSKDIFLCNMLRNQVVDIPLDGAPSAPRYPLRSPPESPASTG